MESDIKILIVDDEKPFADNLARLLGSRGFTPVFCYSGEEALESASKQEFDVIISDIKMPGMDGIELLTGLKEITPQTEVIMLTGYADIETGNRAIREGAFDYLFKPVEDIELLADKIRDAVKAEQIRRHPVLWQRKKIWEVTSVRFIPLNMENSLARALQLLDPALSGITKELLHVTDPEGMLCGVISRNDLIRAARDNINMDVEWKELLKNPQWLPGKKVEDEMGPLKGLYVSPDEMISSVARLMIRKNLHYIPVIDDRHLTGIVHLKDILYCLG
ncbi:MAG: response regulator [Desulfobacteraceae bacterium]